MILKSIFVLLFYCHIGARKAHAEHFIIEDSSPAIVGANVTFTVTVTNHTGELLRFWFYDGTGYSATVFTRDETFNHSIKCKKEKYDSGSHTFILNVYRRGEYYNWRRFGSAYTTFTLTETLNGGPKMIQRGEDLHTNYVYPYEPVYHYLEIPHEEHMYLEQEPTARLYYWYINCALVDVTRDFCILHTYRDAQETYDLRVVLVVKKKSSTTTTTTTTTTTAEPILHPGIHRDFGKSGSRTTPEPDWYPDGYNNQNSRTSERTSRRNDNWDDDQSSGTSSRPSRTTERYKNWYNRRIAERISRRYHHWEDDDQSSETSPRPSRTTESGSQTTTDPDDWYPDDWHKNQNSRTSERPTSRRYHNWDDDQISGTSPRSHPTTTENYNRGTSERTSRRSYNWDDDQNNGTSPAHNITKRGVYNGHYKVFDDGQCMPNIGGVFVYGVYDQTIHIIDRNNLPTTSTTTTSTTTSKPLIIIDPIWSTTTESPPPPTPTTDKVRDISVTVLNSTLTGNISPFSISSVWSQKELPKNIHFKGILNMILKGSFNIEYSET